MAAEASGGVLWVECCRASGRRHLCPGSALFVCEVRLNEAGVYVAGRSPKIRPRDGGRIGHVPSR